MKLIAVSKLGPAVCSHKHIPRNSTTVISAVADAVQSDSCITSLQFCGPYSHRCVYFLTLKCLRCVQGARHKHTNLSRSNRRLSGGGGGGGFGVNNATGRRMMSAS
jgi:hypothetical protein